ncbi:MAG: DUF4238 domain-containing protein [Alphaproteobacteria bacterium]
MAATSSPAPKAHHYIPRMHLQYFVGERPAGHIWTTSKKTGLSRSGKIEQTAKENYFYSVENEDGTFDSSLEALIGTIEADAAPVYRSMLDGIVPEDGTQEKWKIAGFMALQRLRTPAMRRDSAELVSQMLQTKMFEIANDDSAFQRSVDSYQKSRGTPMSTEDKKSMRDALRDPSAYILAISKGNTFGAFLHIENLTNILFNLQYTLLEAKHGYFISSDDPVVFSSYPAWRAPHRNTGLLDEQIHVTMPLSRRLMLGVSRPRRKNPHVVLLREAVDHLNILRVMHAYEFIYSPIQDKRIERLASVHKNSRPVVRLSRPGPRNFAPVEVPRRWRSRGKTSPNIK